MKKYAYSEAECPTCYRELHVKDCPNCGRSCSCYRAEPRKKKSCRLTEYLAKQKLKRGDIVRLCFGPDDYSETRYRVSAVAPDNNLSPDRADVCDITDEVNFKAKRGVGVLVKYLRVVQIATKL